MTLLGKKLFTYPSPSSPGDMRKLLLLLRWGRIHFICTSLSLFTVKTCFTVLRSTGYMPIYAATWLRTQSSVLRRQGSCPDPDNPGEDRQRSPHNDSAAALAGSRPTLSAGQPAAIYQLSPATIHMQPSHLRPSQHRPSHIWPSHQSTTAQPFEHSHPSKAIRAQPPASKNPRIVEHSLNFFFSLIRFCSY